MPSIYPPAAGRQDGNCSGWCRIHRRPGDPPGRSIPAAFSLPVLALAGLEAALGLVDHIDPALAPHDAVVAVPATQGFQRVADFHDDLDGVLGWLAGS